MSVKNVRPAAGVAVQDLPKSAVDRVERARRRAGVRQARREVRRANIGRFARTYRRELRIAAGLAVLMTVVFYINLWLLWVLV